MVIGQSTYWRKIYTVLEQISSERVFFTEFENPSSLPCDVARIKERDFSIL